MQRMILVMVCVLASAAVLSAGQWPAWRGPAGDGLVAGTLPVEWSHSMNVAWTTELPGAGVSTPAVVDRRVYITSQRGSGRRRPGNHPALVQGTAAATAGERTLAGAGPGGAANLVVAAYAWADGRAAWTVEIPATGPLPELHDKHNMATPSPVADAAVVIAWFGNGLVVAFEPDGARLWQRHLGEEYGGFDITWGHASSPVLHGETVYLVAYHSSASYVLALDKRTGVERWKADRPPGTLSYSTPTVIDTAAGPQLVINASTGLEALQLQTGALAWQIPEANRFPIPVATVVDEVLFTTRGYRSGPFVAVRLGVGLTDSDRVLWHVPTGAPYVSSLVHHDGLLYTAGENGIVTCLDAATGARVWQERVGGVFTASPIVNNGHIYIVSESGETVVLRGGRQFDLVARNQIDGHFVASPAASGGRLFLRADDALWAIGPDPAGVTLLR